MARTKQTARKSSGGKAPRSVLATKAARSFRQEMTSRQNSEWSPQAKKISYINHENMLDSYLFSADRSILSSSSSSSSSSAPSSFEKDFALQFSTATNQIVLAPGEVVLPAPPLSYDNNNKNNVGTEYWLSMQPMSKYDGDGIKKHGRPRINIAVALDVSGSMCTCFEADEPDGDPDVAVPPPLPIPGAVISRKGNIPASKIGVARSCLLGLLDQLESEDSFGLVTFNSLAQEIAKMKTITTSSATSPSDSDRHNLQTLREDIKSLKANGMTSLSAGMNAATRLFKALENSSSSSSSSSSSPSSSETEEVSSSTPSVSTNRIYFLTDLASTVDSMNDELALLKQVRDNASIGIYTTVVGFGTDMNQALVKQLSEIIGCKYCSVDSSREFVSMLNEDFGYEVTMVATNIQVKLLEEEQSENSWKIEKKGYGSPEVSEIKNNTALLSSEFAMNRNSNWESKGGIFLFKLTPPSLSSSSSATKAKGKGKGQVKTESSSSSSHSWNSMIAEDKTLRVQVSYRDLMGVRHEEVHEVVVKNPASASVTTATPTTSYSSSSSSSSTSFASTYYQTSAIRKAIAIVRYVDLHNDYIAYDEDKGNPQVNFLEAFSEFKRWYLEEMKELKDLSLGTSNQGDLQLIDKVIELETNEAEKKKRKGEVKQTVQEKEKEKKRRKRRPLTVKKGGKKQKV